MSLPERTAALLASAGIVAYNITRMAPRSQVLNDGQSRRQRFVNILQAILCVTIASPYEEIQHVDSGHGWPVERRTEPRIASDDITLTFLGAHHTAVNWSKIGFLVVDSQPNLPLGAKVTGFVSIRGQEGRFRFTAQLLRRDVSGRQAAFCFETLSSPLQAALSRAAERAANQHAVV